MTKDLKFLNLKTQITLLEEKDDSPKGIIEAYVSIFDNVDLVGDKIIKGAFKDSLKTKLPKGVWMHNWDEPIAKTLIAREDSKGLYIKGQLIMGVQKAEEAYALMKEGVIDEFSIGYRVLDDELQEDGTRVLKKIKLYEWSPVLAGANPATELVSVKEEAPELKIKFVKISKGKVKTYFSDGTKTELKMSNRYFKYLKARAEKREKVEAKKDNTIIRLVAKQIDKSVEKILRITK